MMTLRCQIITQERLLYDEDVDIVLAPAIGGVMGILPRHAPIVATLDYGELVVKKGGIEEAFAIGGGILQVSHDHVRILADSAESSDEIDIARAEEARQSADKSMEEGAREDPATRKALEEAMRRADLRIQVARKYRKVRPRPGPGAMDFKEPEEE